jgi:hypothetical protein
MIAARADQRASSALTLTRVARHQLFAVAALVAVLGAGMLVGVHSTFIHAVAVFGGAAVLIYAPLISRAGMRLRLALDDLLASEAELPRLSVPIQSALRRRAEALTSGRGRERMARTIEGYAHVAKRDPRAAAIFTPSVAGALAHSDEIIEWIVRALPSATDVRALATLDRFLASPRQAGASTDATLRQVAFLLECDLQRGDDRPAGDAS